MIIPLNTVDKSYNITLERGAICKADEIFDFNRRVLVVTDSGVPEEYSQAIADRCKTAVKVCVPQGEQSKGFHQFEILLKAMLDNGFSRHDCVVAVGGGVVGDLSGFAAACYMRGIDFYNVPTTLLSQVDSSVGGKTAIDFNGIKNIVGAFYQPKGVIIDPDTLKTLDKRQFFAGLCEALKMAVTSDEELFAIIENSDDIFGDIDEIIRRSVIIKRDVVEKDPKETGLRKILNFGHTIGHAVESASGGKLLHGECVGMGMLPMCDGKTRERVKKALQKYGLPTEITASTDELLPYITHDKKACGNGISAVVSNKIGSFEIVQMSIEKITERLETAR